jgi:hypothetical protein
VDAWRTADGRLENPRDEVNNPPRGVWRSPVARLLWEQDVGGSNPLTPTNVRCIDVCTMYEPRPLRVAQMQGGREVASGGVPFGYVAASDERPTQQLGRYERPSVGASSSGG